ncbi:MAG: hypothetical protein ACRDG3_02895 [Tepidiformaceae bacterium]
MKTYTREYFDDCRARLDRDLAAYNALAAPIPTAFESAFFNNMVLLLDYLFVHRLRMVEGKDGNAMNEVRVLCNSILNNKGILTADNVGDTTAFAGLNALKLSPEKSILKYRPGDQISLTEADFRRLSAAFFEQIEQRFL